MHIYNGFANATVCASVVWHVVAQWRQFFEDPLMYVGFFHIAEWNRSGACVCTRIHQAQDNKQPTKCVIKAPSNKRHWTGRLRARACNSYYHIDTAIIWYTIQSDGDDFKRQYTMANAYTMQHLQKMPDSRIYEMCTSSQLLCGDRPVRYFFGVFSIDREQARSRAETRVLCASN